MVDVIAYNCLIDSGYMGVNYYRAKKDNNHNRLSELLRSYGWFVLDLSPLKNVCDAVAISPDGMAHFIEFKSHRRYKLTDGELQFKQRLEMAGMRLHIMVDEADVEALIYNKHHTVTLN